MKKTLNLIFVAILAISVIAVYGISYMTETETKPEVETPVKKQTIYKYSAENIDGVDTSLNKYKGDVLLIVNTASKCGYTPQYEGLQAIYDKYKDQGFKVLGFPTNDFGGQEPGSNEEIKDFCTLKYKVSFPMFAKISVKGEETHPLYKFLMDEKANPDFAGEITWNFNKFLINDRGEVVARFSSKDTPESEAVTTEIEKYLAMKGDK